MKLSLQWLVYALAFGALAACDSKPIDEFHSRNGASEALADLQSGRPISVYSYFLLSAVPTWITPGLAYCDPWSASDQKAFRGLPVEASEHPARQQNRIQGSAIRFAETYNLEVYRLRMRELRKLCPEVETEEQVRLRRSEPLLLSTPGRTDGM